MNSYRKLKNLLEETGKDYEIFFRNDASKDDSVSIIEEIEQKDNKVRIFSHTPNKGLGYTLRKLFNSAHGEIVVYLDIDLSFDMSVFPSFLDQIKLTTRCFAIHIDLFAQIQKAGFKMKETPVRFIHNFDAGTFRVLKHGPKALLETLNVWWNIT